MLGLFTHKPNEAMTVYTSYSPATARSAAGNKVKEVPQNTTSNFRIEPAELGNCKLGLLAELSVPEN